MGEFINDNLELEYTKARRILLQEKEINLELKSISAKFEKKKEQIKKEFEKNDKELEDEYSIEEKKLIRELEYINKEKAIYNFEKALTLNEDKTSPGYSDAQKYLKLKKV